MTLEISGSRITSSAVTFFHPFRVGRDHRELPAGTYMLQTQEDVYQGGFGPVYHAVSIYLSVEEPAGRKTARVVLPHDVSEALIRGRQQPSLPALPNENPDMGCAV